MPFPERATFPSGECRDAVGRDDAWLTDRPPVPLPVPFALRPYARPRRADHWANPTFSKASNSMTHIAIQEALNGSVAEWLEKVSDDQYLSNTS